jgi:ppGpp synthetase/RelA/SpoT-type nucleotidyltranferase
MTITEPDPDFDNALRVLELTQARREWQRFHMTYEFAIAEVITKVDILRGEFNQAHDYNPIEHVTSRLKTPEGIAAKAARIDCPLDLASVRSRIRDIAGVRVVCSFERDVYDTFDMFVDQTDVTGSRSRTTSRIRNRTATRAFTRSCRSRCSSPPARNSSMSRCSSAPSPWTPRSR